MDAPNVEFVQVKIESVEDGQLVDELCENEDNLEKSTEIPQTNCNNKGEYNRGFKTFPSEINVQDETDTYCGQSSLNNEEFILPDLAEQNEFRDLNCLSSLKSRESQSLLLDVKAEKEIVSADGSGLDINLSYECAEPNRIFIKHQVEEEDNLHGVVLESKR